MAFRDWPVDQQQQADALSGLEHSRPIQAFLVRPLDLEDALCISTKAAIAASACDLSPKVLIIAPMHWSLLRWPAPAREKRSQLRPEL